MSKDDNTDAPLTRAEVSSLIVGGINEAMLGVNSQLSEVIAKVNGAVAQPAKPSEDDGPKPVKIDFGDQDLEAMDNTKLAMVISNSVVAAVGQSLSGQFAKINSNIAAQGQNTVKEKFSDRLNVLATKHNDVEHWVPEMKEHLKSNPNLTPDELYVLARAGDTDKATKLDKQYNSASDANKENKNDKPSGNATSEDNEDKIVFGGLTPTSGGNIDMSKSRTDDDKEGDRSPNEILDAAFDKTVGELPSEMWSG